MRYSQLFGKTVREAPKDAKLLSHKFLYQAGFIRELSSGRYSLLPLGLRVQDKIKAIIKEEMDLIGAQQIITPTLHPLEFWEKTNRTKTMGPTLMHLKDRREAEFVLGATHEEVFVDLVKKFNLSEKDLPLTLYQFSIKFRDEMRARGGLIRVREFVMKDAYSFNESVESLDRSYDEMFTAYQKIFKRIAVPVVSVEADSGAIGGKISHEFMYENASGEDTYVICNKCTYRANAEKAEGILPPKNQDENEQKIEEIDASRGVNMEEMGEFYKCPLWRLLKTVIYKIKKGKQYSYIAILIRGDLEINELKLAKILKTEEFTLADDSDLVKLNTIRGFVGPVNLKVEKIYVDRSVTTVKNITTGANKLHRDFRNFNLTRDLTDFEVVNYALVNKEFICNICKDGHLELKKGIEMGHVFRLDYYYSRPMEANFISKDGKQQFFLMGCYGIGLERAIAAVVEANHDQKGIIWPESVSPYQVHLIGLNLNDEKIARFAEAIYVKLQKSGIDVLFDDRVAVSPGVKFADCDLIGIPVRLVVSAKTEGKIELKKRNESKIEFLSPEELHSHLKADL